MLQVFPQNHVQIAVTRIGGPTRAATAIGLTLDIRDPASRQCDPPPLALALAVTPQPFQQR